MPRRIFLTPILVLSAFIILFISVTQTAQVKYSFNTPGKIAVLGDEVLVNYNMPYTGRIAPDHVLWPIKAARDRIWILVTPDTLRKAELNLLFANKRVVSAKSLFMSDKPELGMSVLTKAEKYLEDSKKEVYVAIKEGESVNSFLHSLALATLKHRETIVEILQIAPDDAKPEIAREEEKSKRIFADARDTLSTLGEVPPKNPFDGN